MAKEENGEDPSGNGCSSSSRLRRRSKLVYSLPPRKNRLLKAIPLRSPNPCSRNTTVIFPNFSNCHSCKTRSSILKEGADRLQTLPSNWRVVLLCLKCLDRVDSAQICSYCFSRTSRSEDGLDCQECGRRIHRGCIAGNRRGDLPEPKSVLFTCVDCWAPKSPTGGSKGAALSGHSCSRRRTRSLEDVVKDANLNVAKTTETAAKAKETALKKAAAARKAAQVARSALDLLVLAAREESGSASVIDDGDLALLLHRAMNSSPRISKALGLPDFSSLAYQRKLDCNGSDSGSHSVCGKLEACTDVKLSRNHDKSDMEPSVGVGAMDQNSSVAKDGAIGSFEGVSEAALVEKLVITEDKLEMLPMKEEQASCSNMVINSSGDDNCVDSVSGSCQKQNGSMNKVPSKCSRPQCRSVDDGDSSRLQKKRYREPDSCLKKFSKRHSSIKAFLARVMSSA